METETYLSKKVMIYMEDIFIIAILIVQHLHQRIGNWSWIGEQLE